MRRFLRNVSERIDAHVLYNNSLLILVNTSFKVNSVWFQMIDTYQASDELDSATNDSTILYYKDSFITHRKDSQFSAPQTIAGQKYARAKFFHVLMSDFGFFKQRQNFANTNTCVLWLIPFYQICRSCSVGLIE